MPVLSWEGGGPTQGGLANVGVDIVLPLVQTAEPAGADPEVPDDDYFVVERIVGQWYLRSEQAIGRNYHVHERVYVVESGANFYALRDLVSREQADTSFLYHNVTAWMGGGWTADTWGNWQNGSTDVIPAVQNAGQHGPLFRDIRVGRRIAEGESLIYHWQFAGTIDPEDDDFFCKSWIRVLLSKRS